MFGVVEHFDSATLEDVLYLIILNHFIELPLLLLKSKAVDGINLNPFCDFCSFLDHVLVGIVSLVV